MKHLIILAFLFSATLTAYSQYNVSGTILDSTRKPLAYVTVSAIYTKNTEGVTTSAQSGNYNLILAKGGKYRFRFSHVGYKTLDTLIEIKGDITLNVMMFTENRMLSSVEINSRQPLIESSTSGLIFNVENSLLSTGRSAAEILPLVPGVLQDIDGGLNLNGKPVTVMVNDRELRLSGQQLILYLNGIRSENIKSIEAMSYASAAYDAAGVGGILKIITRKVRDDGYNIAINSGYKQGRYPKANSDVNILYKTGKTTFYANTGMSFNRSYTEITTTRMNTSSPLVFDIKSNHLGNLYTYNGKAGMDLDLKATETMGFELSFGDETRNYLKNSFSDTHVYSNGILDSLLHTFIPFKSTNKNISGSAYFINNTDQKGGFFKLNADFYSPRSDNNTSFYNDYYDNAGNHLYAVNLRNEISSDISLFSIKADKRMKLKENTMTVDYGVKLSTADNSAKNYYENYNGENWQVNTNQTNQFRYTEKIVAGYLSLDSRIKMIQIALGLRTEYTHSLNKMEGQISGIKRDYINLFPNVSAVIALDSAKRYNMTLHFRKRITRPAYEILNQWSYQMDQYSFKRGNPYLRPVLDYSYSSVFNIRNKHIITALYSYTEDLVSDVQIGEGNYVIQTFENLPRQHTFSLSESTNLSISKAWMTVLQIQGTYKRFYSSNYSANNLGLQLSNVNILHLSPTFDAQTIVQFVTKGADRYYRLDNNFFYGSISLQQKLLSGNLLLKTGVDDILKAKGNRKITYLYGEQSNITHIENDSRTISVGLTYLFKSGKSVQKKEKEKSNDDEVLRTK